MERFTASVSRCERPNDRVSHCGLGRREGLDNVEILLIRHGDPDYANDSLTPQGIFEAQRLAEALEGVDIDI